MGIKSLTFVVMKFNRVLHSTVSHRPKPRNRRNSLDKPRQPPAHRIEHLHLRIQLLSCGEAAAYQDPLQYALGPAYL